MDFEKIKSAAEGYKADMTRFLRDMISYPSESCEEKDVVMCASNNKEMYTIKRLARKVDPKSFTIIMESNEVVGEGFKEELEEL